MPKDNEVDEKAVAWLITYTERDGSKRQAVYTHNAIADWRMFDPAATSEPLAYAATVAELRARVAELEADARRYRYLRDNANPDSDEGFAVTTEAMNGWGKWCTVHISGTDLDAAIDTATGADPT